MTAYESLNPTQQIEYLHSLAEKALPLWSMTGAILELIKYRENAVFKVKTRSGKQYALRLHRPGYHSDVALLSELQWIQSLEEHGIDSPQVIPTSDGHLFAKIFCNKMSADEDPEIRQVDMFAWVNGEQLGSAENGLGNKPGKVRDVYRTIGQLSAQLHNQASQWQLPDGFQRHAWDLEGLVGETPFWGPFWALDSLTDIQKELIDTAKNSIKAILNNYGKESTHYSMIHADLVPENLLLEGKRVRLIDFDDAGFGWHMFEIATALYFIQNDPQYEVAKTALIEGYREHRSLPDSELSFLPLFLAARGFTYLGWVQSRQETETAREMTPQLVKMACDAAGRFLQGLNEVAAS